MKDRSSVCRCPAMLWLALAAAGSAWAAVQVPERISTSGSAVDFSVLSPAEGMATGMVSALWDELKPLPRRMEAAQEQLRAHPDDPAALLGLGDLLLEARRLDEAAGLYWRAARRDRSSPVHLERLAFAFLTQGDAAHAEPLLRAVVAAEPDRVAADSNLAAAAYERADLASAEKIWRRWSARRPAHARLAYNLGVCLLAQERFTEAADALRRAHEAEPRQAFIHCALFRACLAAGLTKEAQDHQEAILQHLDEASLAGFLARPRLPVFLLR